MPIFNLNTLMIIICSFLPAIGSLLLIRETIAKGKILFGVLCIYFGFIIQAAWVCWIDPYFGIPAVIIIGILAFGGVFFALLMKPREKNNDVQIPTQKTNKFRHLWRKAKTFHRTPNQAGRWGLVQVYLSITFLLFSVFITFLTLHLSTYFGNTGNGFFLNPDTTQHTIVAYFAEIGHLFRSKSAACTGKSATL